MSTPLFAKRAHSIHGSLIDSSISKLQHGPVGIVSFAMGCPSPECIPVGDLQRIAHMVLGNADGSALNYGPTEGERGLRTQLLDLLQAHGQPVTPDRLLVTAGGMQGLDLVCKLFVGPGDLVLAEGPTYSNGAAVIQSYEGDVVHVPTDDDGMVTDQIPDIVARAGRTPRVIYCIPNFQNPTGSTLSLQRRHELLALAEQYDAVIIDDDPYGWLRYEGAQLPTLLELDDGRGRVVTVHTASKILAPGLRVGWTVAAPHVIDKMLAAKQGMDTCTNVLGQRLLAGFLEQGLLEPHLAGLRTTYRHRRDVMVSALSASFSDVPDVCWTVPKGGFFNWMELPQHVDTDNLSKVAFSLGVAFVPGGAFSVNGAHSNALRLCFTYGTPAEIGIGVQRLRAAYEAVSA